jgi:hypothetical protein
MRRAESENLKSLTFLTIHKLSQQDKQIKEISCTDNCEDVINESNDAKEYFQDKTLYLQKTKFSGIQPAIMKNSEYRNFVVKKALLECQQYLYLSSNS